VALAQQQSAQPEKLAEQLGEAAAMTSSAIREVREISQGLRPFQLDELGLGQALEAVVRKLAAATPIRFVAEIAELRGVFPPEFEISFYRIVQECLNNVVKHSEAGECRVLVTRSGSQVRAEIADNGRGLAGGARRGGPAEAEGFGLASIRERVRTLGGTVEFTSPPEGGTRVVVVVPRHP
jgi:signal transduction histidine kinase